MRPLIALAVVAACKGKAPPPPPPPAPQPAPEKTATTTDTGTAECDAALEKAPTVPANRRAQSILEACHPCGDWKPILEWNTRPDAGGPTRLSIETTMAACGFCDANGKDRFLGLLDDARGTASRAPWRALGEVCKAQTSAVPDGRFMSAPYYALDRIARAAAARDTSRPLLAAIELELPALSIVGVGVELPSAAVISPKIGPWQMTVSPVEIRIGKLPIGKLTAAGVAVDHGGEPYPGTLVDPKALDGALDPDLTKPVAIFAPRGMAASALYRAIAGAPKHLLVLAVGAHGAPIGWQLPGTIPIPLDAKPDPKAPVFVVGASADAAIATLKTAPNVAHYTIAIGADATVESFATLLGAIAYRSPERVSVQLVEPRRGKP